MKKIIALLSYSDLFLYKKLYEYSYAGNKGI